MGIDFVFVSEEGEVVRAVADLGGLVELFASGDSLNDDDSLETEISLFFSI